MKKRGLISIFLVVTMTIMLTSCGKASTGSGVNNGENNSTAQTTEQGNGAIEETAQSVEQTVAQTDPVTEQTSSEEITETTTKKKVVESRFMVSLTEEGTHDIVMEGNQVKSFYVKDEQGEDVKIICEGVTADSDMKMHIKPGGAIFSATPIGRVIAVKLKDVFYEDGDIYWTVCNGYGSNKEVIEQSKDVTWGRGSLAAVDTESNKKVVFDTKADYFLIAPDGYFTVDSFEVVYEDDVDILPFDSVSFDEEYYGVYVEGELYDPGREGWDIDAGIYDFYLCMRPEGIKDTSPEAIKTGSFAGTYDYIIGDLCDVNGKVKNKATDGLCIGDYLQVKIAGNDYNVALPVFKASHQDSIFACLPYSTTFAKDEINVLVVPYYYADQEGAYTQERVDNIKKCLGRVIDRDGNVTEYSIGTDGEYSLSEYYDIVSYGNVHINSFVTECYKFPSGSYAEFSDSNLSDEDIKRIQNYLNRSYSDIYGITDSDGNGYYDAVIIICAGSEGHEGYNILSINGAYQSALTWGTERVNRDKTPVINNYVMVGEMHLYQDRKLGEGNPSATTLIHEFGHEFGLLDYYDVTYSGINAVGGYDMQSDNLGDWNPYSKYLMGWVSPVIVTPDEIDEKGSVEITLRSFADTGDCLVIPTVKTVVEDGKMSPFNEYMIIDYFTATGVNKDDAEFFFGQSGVNGVRMFHVDARMIERNLTDTVHNTEYVVSTELKNNAFNKSGEYMLELIQKSGVNTLTDKNNLNTKLTVNDFFAAGDSFSMAKHKAFFTNGLMDDGSEFPYVITVKSITEEGAIITISK